MCLSVPKVVIVDYAQMVRVAVFSRLFRILEILVDSNPIFGPKEVDGVPVLGSILNKVKPVAIVPKLAKLTSCSAH